MEKKCKRCEEIIEVYDRENEKKIRYCGYCGTSFDDVSDTPADKADSFQELMSLTPEGVIVDVIIRLLDEDSIGLRSYAMDLLIYLKEHNKEPFFKGGDDE